MEKGGPVSAIFIGYSRRNIRKVSGVVSALSDEFGSDRIWFARQQISSGDDFAERIRTAMTSASIFLNLESSATVDLSLSDLDANALSESNDFVLYERDLALKLGMAILNVAIGETLRVATEFSQYKTFNLTESIENPTSQDALRDLFKAISEIVD